jgi:myo-inositol 2-dehydrogenase/D-chiro-inositol 1-dehydrogenase
MSKGIGIIGAGVMGADHARTLAVHVGGAELVAVSDADDTRAAAAARANGAWRHYSDGFALIEDPAVEAVLVASPDATHVGFVLACLKAGKPVLCEKPLAPTAGECLEVIEAERRLGRRMVQVGFMRRFDPAYGEMHDVVKQEALGRPLLLHCAHRNATAPGFFTPEMSITNAAVHEFDILRWLTGREIVAVTTLNCARKGAGPLRDPLMLLVELDGGILADVEVFMNAAYGYDVRTELVCESGTVDLGRPLPNMRRFAGGQLQSFPGDWRGRFGEAYRLQMQAWVAWLVGGEPRGADAWDGYAAMRVADAALQSLESGARIEVATAGPAVAAA